VRLIVAVGARPNVVKVGPLLPELLRAGIDARVAFTGSRRVDHPEDAGGSVSFYGVEMMAPDWFLDIGTGTDAVQTGRAMAAFEELFAVARADAVLVVGDVNPTLAAAVSAAKAGLPVVHLQAGLRCRDLRVPEEVNRVLISRVAAMHLTPSERALENLEDEGVDPERIHFVGNMMAESVIRHMDKLGSHDATQAAGFPAGEFVLGSFHRPENLRSLGRMTGITDGIARSPLPVVIPDAGGFAAALDLLGIERPASLHIVNAVHYRDMLALERDAAAVLTDSSGVQEEACTIQTPCITVRECTEHSATVDVGANTLVAADAEAIRAALVQSISSTATWRSPKRWDQAVSDRVVRALKRGILPLS